MEQELRRNRKKNIQKTDDRVWWLMGGVKDGSQIFILDDWVMAGPVET